MSPPPMTLTFDPLTLKVVFESQVTWATSVPVLVFLGLSVLDLRLRTKFGERAFSHSGPSAWNRLPEDIRAEPDITNFRKLQIGRAHV